LSSTTHALKIGDWRVDPSLDEIHNGTSLLKLEPRTMRVLLCLAERAGDVVSVEQLLDTVWKDVVVTPNSVYQAIAELRRALGDDPRTPSYIVNVLRRGYRLIAPVERWAETKRELEIGAGRAVATKRAVASSAPLAGAESSAHAARHAAADKDLRTVAAMMAHRPESQSDDATLETMAAASAATEPQPVRVAICVLPFSNVSGDADQQAFTEGFSEDVITELTRWRLLEVRSRLASFRYRGTALDIARVARELNVRFVVEGSVRRMGDRIRITVQLIDATNGKQVWGDRFDRRQAELFTVQDEVVQTIVSTVVGRVQVTDADRARRKHPASLEAYECVLKGNALPWSDPAGAAEATRLFEKAIEIDPDYGMAYALLAIRRKTEWIDQPGKSTAALDQAFQLAMRAVELDDSESTCHSMLALVSLYRRGFEFALQHMKRAVELNPNNQWNMADMASLLQYAGEAEQALAWTARAKQADPYFDPPWYWGVVGGIYTVLHRYREALTMFEHIPLPDYRQLAYMAACHARLGDVARARECVAQCLSRRPDFSISHLMAAEPFKLSSDAEHLEQSLRLAGLPG
jgi:TolB-like protein/DNA-binding winged helix-turn-helix (wHTH) protein